jgi:hypothetical protein
LKILRKMIVLGTYTFHVQGEKQELTGKVLEYVGGSWILMDTRGTRRLINLDLVGCIDILSS